MEVIEVRSILDLNLRVLFFYLIVMWNVLWQSL